MKTFDEVADHHSLKDVMRERYINYMRTRWSDEEETQCVTGYAAEWATRFKQGEEYGDSDSIGQAILRGL